MAYKGKRGKQQHPLSRIADRQKLFWSKVNKGSQLECWNWTASTKSGYGVFWDGKRRISAHRYSLELHLGKPIPGDLWVLHVCGNRRCVNPAHLYLGDAKDNAVDRDRHLIQDMMGVDRQL